MAESSSIEWTDATWNPVTGCDVVSPGCTNCYAMRLAGTRLKHIPSRASLTRDTKAGPVWNGEIRVNEEWMDQPLRWKRPRMIFVCAHGDLFHEKVPDEVLDRVFAVMALSPQHTFQVLTKRSARLRDYINRPHGYFDHQRREDTAIERACWDILRDRRTLSENLIKWPWPLPNVWLGVSAEDQKRADERIPDLLATPASIRFVSAEPLLGPINLRRIRIAPDHHTIIDALDGYAVAGKPGRERTMLDWVIVGGESGRGARPMHPAWARQIRDQCENAGVPFFFKQWGIWAVASEANGHDDSDMSRNDAVWLHSDGRQTKPSHLRPDLEAADYRDPIAMFPATKKRAGRLLDGVEHNAMPQPREVPAL